MNDTSINGDCPWCGEYIDLEIDHAGCELLNYICPNCGHKIIITVVHEYYISRDEPPASTHSSEAEYAYSMSCTNNSVYRD